MVLVSGSQLGVCQCGGGMWWDNRVDKSSGSRWSGYQDFTCVSCKKKVWDEVGGLAFTAVKVKRCVVCTGVSANGSPCKSWAARGLTLCKRHSSQG